MLHMYKIGIVMTYIICGKHFGAVVYKYIIYI